MPVALRLYRRSEGRADRPARAAARPPDGQEALSEVDSGVWQLAFLLNPARVSSVLAVADASARMPQKSTYFYPKTATGLVMKYP